MYIQACIIQGRRHLADDCRQFVCSAQRRAVAFAATATVAASLLLCCPYCFRCLVLCWAARAAKTTTGLVWGPPSVWLVHTHTLMNNAHLLRAVAARCWWAIRTHIHTDIHTQTRYSRQTRRQSVDAALSHSQTERRARVVLVVVVRAVFIRSVHFATFRFVLARMYVCVCVSSERAATTADSRTNDEPTADSRQQPADVVGPASLERNFEVERRRQNNCVLDSLPCGCGSRVA